jgi:pimeloyl-ACP methyl ester carboxylesterase
MLSRPRLILFSGLGVDARLVQAQQSLDADIEVPPWIEPLENESLAGYSKRFAQQLDLSRPAFVGGISFGGMIAQEVARHVPTRGLVLLATCRSGREVPLPYRVTARIARRLPLWSIRIGRRLASPLKPLMGLLPSKHLAWFDGMIADTDPAMLRWCAGALVDWPGAGPLTVPLVQIQGTRDLILPARLTKPTHLIPGGHLANITHTAEVNAIVQRFLDGIGAPSGPSPCGGG